MKEILVIAHKARSHRIDRPGNPKITAREPTHFVTAFWLTNS